MRDAVSMIAQIINRRFFLVVAGAVAMALLIPSSGLEGAIEDKLVDLFTPNAMLTRARELCGEDAVAYSDVSMRVTHIDKDLVRDDAGQGTAILEATVDTRDGDRQHCTREFIFSYVTSLPGSRGSQLHVHIEDYASR